MRKTICWLLVVFVGIGCLNAKTYANKTFLATRSHNDNMAMEYTGWHKQWRKMLGSRWGGTLQAIGFYQASTNKTDLGKYFGIYNSATLDLDNPDAGQIRDFIEVKDLVSGLSATDNQRAFLLESKYLFWYSNFNIPDAEHLNAKGTFRPKQTSYGVRLDYHQKLDKLAKGLYFKIAAPVVHVKNDMRISYTGSRLTQNYPGPPNQVTLSSYLAGTFNVTGTQDALTHAKICGSDSTTGVADVKVTLGYNFLYKEHKHCGVSAYLVIPTNDTPDGVRLFESELGLRGHWAIGLGVDSAFELWQHGNKSLEFVGAINGLFVLPETEKRTLGFKYSDDMSGQDWMPISAGKLVPMGWYLLGGQSGKKGLFPLANVLTRDVTVRPGWQAEGIASLAFNWTDFTFDLGYNLFAKERESVMEKNWPNDTYARATISYNTDDAFSSSSIFGNGSWIQRDDLITEVAATPVYVTHKIFGGATYAFNDWEYPFMLGLGASWEFTQGTNSALDGYALWAKVALAF
jgi:hypothetical protein